MPATIRDVARASGVHISTVSRTFSAPHLVNPETRSRVLACAEELGYRPNRAARALITGRTHNIGLIVADIANPFFPPLIKAAESQARQPRLPRLRGRHQRGPGRRGGAGPRAGQAGRRRAAVQPADEQQPDRAAQPRGAAGRGQPAGRRPARRGDGRRAGRPARRSSTWSASATASIALLGGPRGSWTNREIRRAAGAAARAGGAELDRARPQPAHRGRRRGRRRAGARAAASPPCSPTTT